MGPDGTTDIQLHLTNLQPYSIPSVAVSIGQSATTPANWYFGSNPDGVARAELIREDATGNSTFPYKFDYTDPTADLYINPPANTRRSVP